MSHSQDITHCHECGLKVRVPLLDNKHKALCPRCGYKLTSHRIDGDARISAYAITALLFLLLSLPFEFIEFSAGGKTQTMSIPTGLIILMESHYVALAILESLFILFIPALIICSVLVLQGLKDIRAESRLAAQLVRSIFTLLPWSMAEIFLISVLVSLIKIVSLADISLGYSFYCFCLFVIFNTLMLKNLDEYQLKKRHGSITTAAPLRKVHSVQHTWAFLMTAILFYIPANFWPIMETNVLGRTELSTIMGGVIHLWGSGSYPIAAIIFIASVVVPVAKLIIICWLNAAIGSGRLHKPEQKIFWYRVTEFIGKWSMVDVFVVAILVSLVQLGGAMTILPGPAAIAFSGVVIATMLAANSFNPTLIWKTPSQ